MADPDLPSPPDPVIAGAARVQVVLPSLSGLARDSFVNTFHFYLLPTTITDAMLGELCNYIDGAYNNTQSPGTSPLASFIGDAVDRTTGVCKMNCYRLGESHPRVPFIHPWTLGAGGGSDNGVPPEVAMCVSYHDTHVSGSKLRFGRTYIGPLRSTVFAAASPHVNPTGAFRNALVGFGTKMMNIAGAGLSMPVNFGILSRKHANITSVSGGFVDNEFDTQRRRGQRATSRTTF